MYTNNKVLLGKSWAILFSLQLLLGSPLLSSEPNINPGSNSWINQLEQRPTELPSQVKSLDELIGLSLSRNSEIRAQYAQWRTHQDAEKTISNLPDPNLGIGYFIEPVETAQGPQSTKISLGQTIPWRSKIRADRDTREYQSIQSYKALETENLSLIREITSLWVESGYIQSKTSLIDAKIALSRDLEEILSIQYQSASISHKKLVEVQIQTLQLENDLRDLESQFYRLRTKLGSILEIDSPLPDDFLPIQTVHFLYEFSWGEVSSDHPRLQGLEAMLQETGARKASAQAAYIPDLKIGLDYILTDKKVANGIDIAGSGKDPLILSAGIELPLWSWKAKKAAVKASKWQEKKAQAMLDAESSRLAQDYEISQSKLDEDMRLIHLYQDQLIPKAREIEKVMQQEYIGQSSDVFSYTMARQHVLDLQLKLTNAQYSAQLHLADLSYLKGK
ncbi:MAG: TolC family protein [FCB group bacterium]|nr:TolC family protein [FCB group bacterium]MBL7029096.1 TolC family protein [Candidatus Neomarinimicrobiota bacterium]MBL7122576.1 TolC family protein [Candidatus Neomarinimicrobiota bacterium]